MSTTKPPILIEDEHVLALLGDQLKTARTASGLSLEQMATQCDMDAAGLEAIEEGKDGLEISFIGHLAECYGLSSDTLLAALISAPQALDVEQLKQSFLGMDSPNRGKMFQDFIAQLPKN